MREKIGKTMLALCCFLVISPAMASAYTIQHGDTLSQLAQQFGVKLEELLKINPEIDDPDLIYAGQTLKLPNSPSYHDSKAQFSPSFLTAHRWVMENSSGEMSTYYITPMEKYWLARIVHAEAKGEPFAGKVAVVHVILNRVRHEAFPDTIREVIFQPGQFQPVANGSIYQEPDEESVRAVEFALKTYGPEDQNILYFYNPKIATSKWIFTRSTVKVIGNHVFAR